MDLSTAQELLRDPKALTIEQWRQAYEVIQEHNIRRSASAAGDGAGDSTLDD